MEKEYYTVENYNKLKGELKELEERKVELEKEYKTAAGSYYAADYELDNLFNKYYDFKAKYDRYLGGKSDIVDTLPRIFGLINIGLYGILLKQILNISYGFLWITCFAPGAVVIGIGSVFLIRKLVKKSREKVLKKSKKYLELQSEYENVVKEKTKKLDEHNQKKKDYNASFKKFKSINYDIMNKKQEISAFERECLSIYLNQEDKELTSHKTRVLANN